MPAHKKTHQKKKPQNNPPINQKKKRNNKWTPTIYKVYLYYFAHKIILSTPARFTADLSYVFWCQYKLNTANQVWASNTRLLSWDLCYMLSFCQVMADCLRDLSKFSPTEYCWCLFTIQFPIFTSVMNIF